MGKFKDLEIQRMEDQEDMSYEDSVDPTNYKQGETMSLEKLVEKHRTAKQDKEAKTKQRLEASVAVLKPVLDALSPYKGFIDPDGKSVYTEHLNHHQHPQVVFGDLNVRVNDITNQTYTIENTKRDALQELQYGTALTVFLDQALDILAQHLVNNEGDWVKAPKPSKKKVSKSDTVGG